MPNSNASPAATRLRAAAEIERRRRARLAEGLAAFVPRVSPVLEAPTHLGPLVAILERTAHEEVRAVVSTPPQHGKTELIKHALVWLMSRDPTRRHGYVTYEATRAEQISLEIQRIATEAGVPWEGSRKVWRTEGGGGLIATGIGGPLTGYGINGVLFVDDPIKNREEAESPTYRARTIGWFHDVAITRVHPGASVVEVQTRWHPDDLQGELVRAGWERVNLPAITDGKALWPERRPIEWLEQQRATIGEYSWASLYMGEPRPRGGSIFGDPHFGVVPEGCRYAIGYDLAYTAKTHADYSVAVVLAERQGTYWVAEVVRVQCEAPGFSNRLKELALRYPGARMLGYVGGTEQGVVQMLRQGGLPRLESIPAKTDKFVRAQPAAAAWNAGKISLPHDSPRWLDAFLDEVRDFTGVNDKHDDQVDALAGAFDALSKPKAQTPAQMRDRFPSLVFKPRL